MNQDEYIPSTGYREDVWQTQGSHQPATGYREDPWQAQFGHQPGTGYWEDLWKRQHRPEKSDKSRPQLQTPPLPSSPEHIVDGSHQRKDDRSRNRR